jgi:hypothetical protein
VPNLFDPACATEITDRLDRVQAGSMRQWGKMTLPQAFAHMSGGLEIAVGDTKPPRLFLGRIIGGLVKKMALGNDTPMRRNSPTVPALVITDERDFAAERDRLRTLVSRFVAGGRKGCTTEPHSFFGRLTPDEWGELMYKHIDHHLRQFSA